MLRLEFQDGFSGDLVIVRVEGRQVYRAKARNLDSSLIRLPAAKSKLSVDLQIPARGVFGSFGLNRADAATLCVWLDPGGILRFRPKQ